MRSLINFGYTGWWMYGHVVVLGVALALLLLAWLRRWPWPPKVLLGAVAVWALSAFLVVQFVFRFNDLPTIPTPGYLASGAGRVLDIGAGSGRSSIMVLLERPKTTLVALDNFSATYIRDHGPDKLKANLRAAGVDGRAEVVSADMRKLPFPDASFDAIVSTYAIDHLPRNDIPGALAEAARVVRPGGEFLLEDHVPRCLDAVCVWPGDDARRQGRRNPIAMDDDDGERRFPRAGAGHRAGDVLPASRQALTRQHSRARRVRSWCAGGRHASCRAWPRVNGDRWDDGRSSQTRTC